MKKKILLIGSLNMDYTIYTNSFPLEGETIFGKTRMVQPGGKGANQAAAVAKSGMAIANFIAARGDDSDGKQIESLLKELGINVHISAFKNVETGNATIVVDDNSENKIIIISGANALLTSELISENQIKECDYVVLQNEIPESTNAYVIKTAHKFGKTVVYNPAPFRKFNKELFQYIDFFIPNEIELAGYSETDNIQQGIKAMLDLGVKNLIVTLGSKGSIFANRNEVFQVDSFKTTAIDTVAAGDTYVGYFVSALSCGYSVKESMRIASKASSITVARKGSIVSIPFGEELNI